MPWWVQDPFKVKDRPMDSDVTEYRKFSDMVSVSRLKLIIKKLPLVTTGWAI